MSKRCAAILIAAIVTQNDVAMAETVTSAAPADITVTIYRDDLALISERRIVNLPKGKSTIAFEGVNDRMIPQSAILQEFGAITIERNFDFDLISPATFFKKSLGETVLLTRTNIASGKVTQKEAKIVSSDRGVLLDVDGKIEAYQCSGLSESVDFLKQPENLKPQPTLSIDVEATQTGEQELTISYLASGFSWQADYILTLGEKNKAGLIGWLTVTNGTSISIKNAPTSIVAGKLQILPETQAPNIHTPYFSARCWPRGSTKRSGPRGRLQQPDQYYKQRALPAPMVAMESMNAGTDEIIVTGAKSIAKREDLGDYKLYRTPQPTTVAAHQTKQVLFLDKDRIDVKKTYVFDSYEPDWFEDEITPASVEFRVDNSKEGNLAQPLPAGTFRVMTKTSKGTPFFLGEDDQDDLAIDLPVKIAAADAADILMETTVLHESEKDFRTRTDYQATMQHRFTNASPHPAPIEFTLGKDSDYAFKIDRATKLRVRREALPTWRFILKPESATTLVYRARWTE